MRQTPTLTYWSRTAHIDADKWPKSPEFHLVSKEVRKEWKQPSDEMQNLSDADKALLQVQYDFALRLTGEMAKAGVPILAGTDTGDPWTVPGVELHKELALLVKAGLTPAQALRSATSEPAALMRKSTELGQLKKGYLADIVLLDGNPLTDIRNTTRIREVMLRGKVFDQPQLKQMARKVD